MKKKVDEMHQQDIQAKHRDLEICENVEKEDAKISNTQSEFIYLANDIRKNIDKSVCNLKLIIICFLIISC